MSVQEIDNGWLWLVLASLLIVPGSEKQLFSGMPLNHSLECILLFCLGTQIWGKAINGELRFSLSNRIVFILLVGLLLGSWKWFLFVVDDPPGFPARYRSLMAETPDRLTPPGQHEFSADAFFHSRQITRFDRSLAFDSDWNLGFWNLRRFNAFQWVPGNQIRARNPFEVQWSGTMAVPLVQHASFQCEYTGAARILIGSYSWDLPEIYDTKRCERLPLARLAGLASDACFPFPLSPPRPATFSASFSIFYQFSRESRVGSATFGPNACFSLLFNDDLGPPTPVSAPISWKKPYLAWFAAALDVLILLSIVLVTHFEWGFLLGDPLFLGLTAGWGVVYQAFPGSFLWLASGSMFLFLVFRHPVGEWPAQRWKLLTVLTVLMLLIPNAGIDLSKPLLHQPGSDGIDYETMAREMLRLPDNFLKGNAPVFLFQVFFRYYLASLRVLFGDGSYGYMLFSQYLFYCLLPLLAKAYARRMGFALGVLVALGFLVMEHNLVFYNIQRGWSDHLGWWFLLIGILIGLESSSPVAFLLVALSFGLSSLTRLNLAPGCFLLLICFFLYYGRRSTAIAGHLKLRAAFFLVFFGVLAWIPLHNLIFGGRLAFLPQEVHLPLFSDLPGSGLPATGTWESLRESLRIKLPLLLFLYRLNALMLFWVLAIAGHLVGMWRRSSAEACGGDLGAGETSGPREAGPREAVEERAAPPDGIMLGFLLSPLPFMVVQMFFSIKSGYPRFVVPHFLLMYLFAAYVWGGVLFDLVGRSRETPPVAGKAANA